MQPMRNNTLPVGARLPRFVRGPSDAVERLATWRVGLIAAGSVGLRAAKHFARLGSARIVVIDPATIEPTNLVTYDVGPAAVGRAKAEVAAEECRGINPECDVEAFVRPLADVPLGALADLDVLVCSSDNLSCEVEAGDAAQQLGLPLFLASVDGPTLSAQVRSLANAPDVDGPCVACAYNEAEWRLHDDALRFACAGGTTTVAAAPTMSTSYLCSHAADLLLNQAVRHRLALGESVVDTLVAWSGFTHRTLTSPLVRNPSCRGTHLRLGRIAVGEPLAECTWGSLRERIAAGGDTVVGFEVEGYVFVDGRFQSITASSESIAPYHRRRVAPADQLPHEAALAACGAVAPRGVIAHLATGRTLIYHARRHEEATV